MASRMSNRDRIQRMAQEAVAAEKEKTTAAKAKPKKKAAAKKKAAPKKKAAAKKKAAPKKKAAAKKKAAPRKRKAASKGRVKIVWAVCVPAGKALKIYPFREKAEAQAEAEKLTAKKGTLHVVRSERQPMEADE